MNYSEDTEILYRGMDIKGITENPEVAPIYNTTAYCIKDTEDYAFANNGGKYFYNRTANPNRDCLGESISYLEKGETKKSAPLISKTNPITSIATALIFSNMSFLLYA